MRFMYCDTTYQNAMQVGQQASTQAPACPHTCTHMHMDTRTSHPAMQQGNTSFCCCYCCRISSDPHGTATPHEASRLKATEESALLHLLRLPLRLLLLKMLLCWCPMSGHLI